MAFSILQTHQQSSSVLLSHITTTKVKPSSQKQNLNKISPESPRQITWATCEDIKFLLESTYYQTKECHCKNQTELHNHTPENTDTEVITLTNTHIDKFPFRMHTGKVEFCEPWICDARMAAWYIFLGALSIKKREKKIKNLKKLKGEEVTCGVESMWSWIR